MTDSFWVDARETINKEVLTKNGRKIDCYSLESTTRNTPLTKPREMPIKDMKASNTSTKTTSTNVIQPQGEDKLRSTA